MADENGDQSSKRGWLGLLIGILGLAVALAGVVKAYLETQKTKIETDRAARLESQVVKVSTPAGRYIWEVASERWWGYIDVDDHGVANVQMWKFENCPTGVQKLRLFEPVAGRTAKVSVEQDNRLYVELPVQQVRYDDKCNKAGLDPFKTLKGYLDPTRAYDGEVGYEAENQEAPPGGMILVRALPGGH